MYEDTQEIFDYLPIRQNPPENEYINHLWQAFTTLDESNEAARPFAVMPFHLLFMLSMQYKVLRIANSFPDACNLFFSGVAGRDKDKLLNSKISVFDIALIKERTMPEVMSLIGIGPKEIIQVKELIGDCRRIQ